MYNKLSSARILLHCSIQEISYQGFFQQFWEKAPGQNWEKMSTSKLGEINNIEHNKGSKIYPQNQVILDCIMSMIALKHKCFTIILNRSLFLISRSGLYKESSKKKFTFLNWENQPWYWEKSWLFLIGYGAEIRPLEMSRK